MELLARGGLVHRLVVAVRRGRTPVVLGGPGTGKTTVARAAAAKSGPSVGLLELDDALPEDDRVEELSRSPCVFTGGLELHRWLEARGPACRIAGRTVQRFPLVPLTRRQTLFWAERATAASLTRDQAESLHRTSGGHPSVIAAWLEHRARGRPLGSVDDALLRELAPLLARIDRELAHPELGGLYAWLEVNGPARISALRAATGAEKSAIDRLVMAGPVSRTLGEVAEIEVGCGLYTRRRGLQSR